MSGTHLFYNGVLLRDCEITQWKQEIVKDDSGTDVLYSKVRLTVESTLVSLVNQRYIGSKPIGLQAHESTIAVPKVRNEDLVERLEEMQWRLQEHRKDFWLAFNGVTYKPGSSIQGTPSIDGSDSYRVVLAATGLSSEDRKKMVGVTVAEIENVDLGKLEGFNDFGLGVPKLTINRKDVIDLNNGPKPIEVSIGKTLGGQSLRISLTIEVCRLFCRPLDTSTSGSDVAPLDGARKVHGVITNKWSFSESINEEWKTEHVISGKIVVSDARYKAHALRLAVVPTLAPYFRFEENKFETDAAGLVLKYVFRMRETGESPPPGIVKWSGTYVESHGPGQTKTASLAIRVTSQVKPVNAIVGNPKPPQQTHKAHLVAAAFRIAQARVRWSSRFFAIPGSNPITILLQNMVVVETMNDPTIELRMNVLYKAEDSPDSYGLRLKNMGAPLSTVIPNHDSRWWPIPINTTDARTWDVVKYADPNTYYDNYFQEPCGKWHASLTEPSPPLTQIIDSSLIPDGASETYFEQILLNSALTSADPLDQPPGVPAPADAIGWTDAKQGDFTYLQCEIDTDYGLNSGNIHLPVSKVRYPTQDTSIVVNLFPGIATRKITMIATRQGDWPIVPAARPVITHGTMKETYIDGRVIAQTPKLTPDGKTVLYALQIAWEYALSRLPDKPTDTLWAAADPRTKLTPGNNQIAISKYFVDNIIEQA